MIIPDIIRQLYEETLDIIKAVCGQVRTVTTKFCTENGYLFEDRIKTLESVAEKIETGRYEKWTEIDDLYACTIIIPLVSDEEEVLSFLNQRFERIKLTRKGGIQKPPDVFRFDSTRFIGRLKKPVGLDSGVSSNVYQLLFEIQIKTVFDFAWTKTTHALTYKSGKMDWRRLRLAAQIKATVEQLDMLIFGFEQTSEYVGKGRWPDIEDKAVIREFFLNKVEDGSLPSELAPKDWSRFSENVYRAFQAFHGDRPTGTSGRKIPKLKTRLNMIADEIRVLGPEKIPRSISLFQFVIGVIGSSKELLGENDKYFVQVTEELMLLYPDLHIPGKKFQED